MSEHYVRPVFTADYYDYESLNTPITVVGRLKENLNYWTKIGASKYILSVLKNGYVIPIKGPVEPVFLRNNLSARQEPNFVRESIDDLLATGAIAEIPNPAFVTNPLTVAKKNGKFRLVIDLRHINRDIVKTKC